MPDLTYRLILKSTHEESARVPGFVSNLSEKASLNEDAASTFMLLLSEAVDNAIQHGNKLDPQKQVSVEIHISESAITATVTDEGEGFDPEEAINPLDEENLLNTGGRGIFLIEELADSVEFMNEGKTIRFQISRQS